MRSMWRIILSVFGILFFMLCQYTQLDHNNLYVYGDGLRFLWIFHIKRNTFELKRRSTSCYSFDFKMKWFFFKTLKHIIRWNGVFEQGFLWICYFYMAYILQSSVYVIWVLNFKNHINKLHFVTRPAKSWKLLFSKIKRTWNYKEIMS